jgi:hypothetical protein
MEIATRCSVTKQEFQPDLFIFLRNGLRAEFALESGRILHCCSSLFLCGILKFFSALRPLAVP